MLCVVVSINIMSANSTSGHSDIHSKERPIIYLIIRTIECRPKTDEGQLLSTPVKSLVVVRSERAMVVLV